MTFIECCIVFLVLATLALVLYGLFRLAKYLNQKSVRLPSPDKAEKDYPMPSPVIDGGGSNLAPSFEAYAREMARARHRANVWARAEEAYLQGRMTSKDYHAGLDFYERGRLFFSYRCDSCGAEWLGSQPERPACPNCQAEAKVNSLPCE